MPSVEHEREIAKYLRDVALKLDPRLPEEARTEALERLEVHIRARLEATDQERIAPTLEAFGPPDSQAEQLSDAAKHGFRGPDTRLWLGVCAYLSQEAELPLWQVRAGATALGLLTGPLALFAYLGIYGVVAYTGQTIRPLPAEWTRAAGQAALAFGIAFAIYWGSGAAIGLIDYAHEQFLDAPPPALDGWDWFRTGNGRYFFWASAFCIPLSILAGLPLTRGWEISLGRFSYALLALYGVAAAFGLASLLVGILLDVVAQSGDVSDVIPEELVGILS